MFDEVPCEMHLAGVTPPLLGLSEVTTDRAVSHTFFILHGILQVAICPWHCFLHNSYLYRLEFIFLLLTHLQVALACADRNAPDKTGLLLNLLY